MIETSFCFLVLFGLMVEGSVMSVSHLSQCTDDSRVCKLLLSVAWCSIAN